MSNFDFDNNSTDGDVDNYLNWLKDSIRALEGELPGISDAVTQSAAWTGGTSVTGATIAITQANSGTPALIGNVTITATGLTITLGNITGNLTGQVDSCSITVGNVSGSFTNEATTGNNTWDMGTIGGELVTRAGGTEAINCGDVGGSVDATIGFNTSVTVTGDIAGDATAGCGYVGGTGTIVANNVTGNIHSLVGGAINVGVNVGGTAKADGGDANNFRGTISVTGSIGGLATEYRGTQDPTSNNAINGSISAGSYLKGKCVDDVYFDAKAINSRQVAGVTLGQLRQRNRLGVL